MAGLHVRTVPILRLSESLEDGPARQGTSSKRKDLPSLKTTGRVTAEPLQAELLWHEDGVTEFPELIMKEFLHFKNIQNQTF